MRKLSGQNRRCVDGILSNSDPGTQPRRDHVESLLGCKHCKCMVLFCLGSRKKSGNVIGSGISFRIYICLSVEKSNSANALKAAGYRSKFRQQRNELVDKRFSSGILREEQLTKGRWRSVRLKTEPYGLNARLELRLSTDFIYRTEFSSRFVGIGSESISRECMQIGRRQAELV